MSRQHERMNRRRWSLVRRRVLYRDGWRCRQCGRAGKLEVDHRIPLEDGGAPYDPQNLQSLCRGCHTAKTVEENRARHPVRPEIKAWERLVGVYAPRCADCSPR